LKRKDTKKPLSSDSIRKNTAGDVAVYVFDTIDSTNSEAKRMLEAGFRGKAIIAADTQTSGRGRLGRSFISNSENGLYMSVILRPNLSPDRCIDITTLTAVSVLEAIEETSNTSPSIKWINDIYINEKKVCGILTESSFDGSRVSYVVVGIGINIIPPENGFDDSIKDIATSIYEKDAPKGYKEHLCAKIIDKLIYHYSKIEEKSYMNKYREKSNIIGNEVDVYRGNDIIKGIALDINDNAALVVKTENGEICVFNSGEARVRKRGAALNEK
jgi:BirA family biotin operon repressor/biotin-[acetyl-CoA-carboxylase] ligase